MVESFTFKRVIFLSGRQKAFLCDTQEKLNIPSVKLARLLKISNRTLTDWKREKFSMSFRVFKALLEKTNKKVPKNIKIKDAYWYVKKGAKAGGVAVYKKYGKIGGNPIYRKKKWYEWWEKEGKYKCVISKPKYFRKPKFSKELAEFTGILLGDGGITHSQITVTLCLKDEREYSKFVIALAKKLFNVPVGVYCPKNKSAINIIISRSGLVSYCKEKIGLKQGNKIEQQVDIPIWIKRNKQYSIACLRGLMDTDGCLFIHRYKVNGKYYKYKKLSFTSYSEPLRQSVFNILRNNGFHPRFAQRKDVRLDSIDDVKRYFKIVSSHNLKYLKRYKK